MSVQKTLLLNGERSMRIRLAFCMLRFGIYVELALSHSYHYFALYCHLWRIRSVNRLALVITKVIGVSLFIEFG